MLLDELESVILQVSTAFSGCSISHFRQGCPSPHLISSCINHTGSGGLKEKHSSALRTIDASVAKTLPGCQPCLEICPSMSQTNAATIFCCRPQDRKKHLTDTSKPLPHSVLALAPYWTSSVYLMWTQHLTITMTTSSYKDHLIMTNKKYLLYIRQHTHTFCVHHRNRPHLIQITRFQVKPVQVDRDLSYSVRVYKSIIYQYLTPVGHTYCFARVIERHIRTKLWH